MTSKLKTLRTDKLNQVALLILCIDILLVLLHIMTGQQNGFFNLDWERNIPTFYQAFKFFVAGALFYAHAVVLYSFLTKQKRNAVLLIAIGTILIFMGLDEAAEVHEMLPALLGQTFPALGSAVADWAQTSGYESSIWIVYALILMLVLAIPALLLIKKAYSFFGRKKFLALCALGVAYLAGAIGVEFIATRGSVFWSESYQVWLVIEESVEMFAISLVLIFSLHELRSGVVEARGKSK